jgi:tetratricopeptide (TPR) repeat protein
VLETKQAQPKRALSTAELIKQARMLQQKEQWSDALLLIRKMSDTEPRDERVVSLEAEIKRDWIMQKRNSEDWILVYETRSLQKKLPHLERLAQIDSENLITQSRLLFWSKLLESKVASLISCGSMHLHLDPALAEACTMLSEEIKPTRESAHLLSKIKKTRAAEKSVQQNKEAVRVKRNLSQQRDRLLAQAIALYEEENYPESIFSLQRLLKLMPNDTEAITLLDEVTNVRDQRVEKLIKFGDALYRDEQIGQAVSVWESAEKLDAGRADIASRIDRAMKVLERLREIKEEQ